eukprot:3564238-Pleurochrysis_carterae.AAC.4
MGGSGALAQASRAGTHNTAGGGERGGWRKQKGDIRKHASPWASQREWAEASVEERSAVRIPTGA